MAKGLVCTRNGGLLSQSRSSDYSWYSSALVLTSQRGAGRRLACAVGVLERAVTKLKGLEREMIQVGAGPGTFPHAHNLVRPRARRAHSFEASVSARLFRVPDFDLTLFRGGGCQHSPKSASLSLCVSRICVSVLTHFHGKALGWCAGLRVAR